MEWRLGDKGGGGCCEVGGGGGGGGGGVIGGVGVVCGYGVDNGVGGVICGVVCGFVCGVVCGGVCWGEVGMVKAPISTMIISVPEKDRWDVIFDGGGGEDIKLVPSFFKIFDLKPLSLSFDFVFSFEIFKSLSFRLDRLCHLAILCLDQHAHTLHHLESLLTISLDRLDIFEGRSCISEFVRKSLSLILELS
ncbi:hypothetical protein Tco_0118009 [Tanacetum coccineum]